MPGKYGTPMNIEKLGPKRKRQNLLARAGAVTITHADGSVEVKPPYPRKAVIRRRKKR